VLKNHKKNLILGDKNDKTQSRRKLENNSKQMNLSLLFKIEPKFFLEAGNDQNWVNSMEQELNQIEKNRHENFPKNQR
jgi:hypothetical protein